MLKRKHHHKGRNSFDSTARLNQYLKLCTTSSLRTQTHHAGSLNGTRKNPHPSCLQRDLMQMIPFCETSIPLSVLHQASSIRIRFRLQSCVALACAESPTISHLGARETRTGYRQKGNHITVDYLSILISRS